MHAAFLPWTVRPFLPRIIRKGNSVVYIVAKIMVKHFIGLFLTK